MADIKKSSSRLSKGERTANSSVVTSSTSSLCPIPPSLDWCLPSLLVSLPLMCHWSLSAPLTLFFQYYHQVGSQGTRVTMTRQRSYRLTNWTCMCTFILSAAVIDAAESTERFHLRFFAQTAPNGVCLLYANFCIVHLSDTLSYQWTAKAKDGGQEKTQTLH